MSKTNEWLEFMVQTSWFLITIIIFGAANLDVIHVPCTWFDKGECNWYQQKYIYHDNFGLEKYLYHIELSKQGFNVKWKYNGLSVNVAI